MSPLAAAPAPAAHSLARGLAHALRGQLRHGQPALVLGVLAPRRRSFFGNGRNFFGGRSDDDAKKEEPPEKGSSKEDGKAQGEVEGGSAPSTDGAIVPVTNGRGLRKDTGPAFEPRIVGLPLQRRPLFPGQQRLLQVTHPTVMKELTKLFERGTPPVVGAFLHKGETAVGQEADEEEGVSQLEDLSHGEPLDHLHLVGTRARIVQVAPFSNTSGGRAMQQDGLQLLLHGHDLVRLDKVLDKGPPLQVQVSRLKLQQEKDGRDHLRACINETLHTVREIMKINPQFREYASMIHQGLEHLERGDPHAIAHFAASLTTASGAELMQVLEAELPSEKLRLVLVLLKKELELSQIQQKIAMQIEEKVSSHQREFMLREQMKMIKKELGEDKSDGTDKLMEKFKQRLEGKEVPKDAKEVIDSEMQKFSNIAKESQEYQITRNYLDWLTLLPWGVTSGDTLSLKKAREILDRDHYGLNDVKERILELIAVGSLRGAVQGKILCFVGPPGVGKTSIGRSIAEALNREFYRFSVGGLFDVAEIKGHRRTYVGAMPGKVIQCLKKTQTANPLVLIDEVDKLGRGHQGDPASALLELLDPSQNHAFLDHYLDVPVDCSKVLFVCTANVTDTIPGPLLDRMEVIRLSGYDLQEKLRIAEDYLVPSAMREVGLWPQLPKPSEAPKAEAASEAAEPQAAKPPAPVSSEPTVAEPEAAAEAAAAGAAEAPLVAAGEGATIERGAVESLIRWYCREAGVRSLQKHIERICRKLATRVVEWREAQKASATEAAAAADAPAAAAKAAATAEASAATADDGSSTGPDLRVTEEALSDFVGKQLFISDRLYEGSLPPGTATGLAWTAMGGSVLYVEVSALPRAEGKPVAPSLSVTGQLGSVMKESSQIALLNARRHLAQGNSGPAPSFFQDNELYLHCPEGATPKDGPSAGVTMTTALLSLATGRPVRTDLAMTGEVSLNGKVLPVGGIKEKTIAARRAGCKVLVFPQANKRDFDELPDYLREGLEVHFAAEYDDVFSVAFPA